MPLTCGRPILGNDSNTLLLLHMDGTNGGTSFSDSSSNARTITNVGSTTTSSTQSMFGGTSGSFNGSSQCLSIPNSADWNISGDFTLEAWVYVTSMATNCAIIDRTGSTYYSLNYFITTAGKLRLNSSPDGSSNTTIDSTGTVSLNTWTHVAAVRSGSTITHYIGGTASGTGTFGSTYYNNATELDIGARANGGVGRDSFFNGYIDELRISKIARWTANFPPPNMQYTSGA